MTPTDRHSCVAGDASETALSPTDTAVTRRRVRRRARSASPLHGAPRKVRIVTAHAVSRAQVHANPPPQVGRKPAGESAKTQFSDGSGSRCRQPQRRSFWSLCFFPGIGVALRLGARVRGRGDGLEDISGGVVSSDGVTRGARRIRTTTRALAPFISPLSRTPRPAAERGCFSRTDALHGSSPSVSFSFESGGSQKVVPRGRLSPPG